MTILQNITSTGGSVEVNTGRLCPVDHKARDQAVQLLQRATDRRRGG